MEQQMMKQLADSINNLGNKFDDFGNRLTKIETMFTMFDKSQTHLANKVDDVEGVARDAMASTKVAHKRLDNLDKDIEHVPSIPEHKNRLDKLEKMVWWAGTTLILTMIGVIGYLIKQGG